MMWQPERRLVKKLACPLCGREVGVEDARRCMSCGRVVCISCFDVNMGVCQNCLKRFSPDDPCPDYIG